jgi:hypothetical protein
MATVNFIIPEEDKALFLENFKKSGCKNQSEFLMSLLHQPAPVEKIRAKFECVKVEDFPNHEQKLVQCTPVIEGSEENRSFAKYTPGGLLELYISYETSASEFFAKGDELYLDIMKTVPAPIQEKPKLVEKFKAAAEIRAAAKPLSKFKFLAVIDGTIQNPVIEAENEAAARAKLKALFPFATTHKCEPV